jgi:hypothetical protein
VVVVDGKNQVLFASFVLNASREMQNKQSLETTTSIYVDKDHMLMPQHSAKVQISLLELVRNAKILFPVQSDVAKYPFSFFTARSLQNFNMLHMQAVRQCPLSGLQRIWLWLPVICSPAKGYRRTRTTWTRVPDQHTDICSTSEQNLHHGTEVRAARKPPQRNGPHLLSEHRSALGGEKAGTTPTVKASQVDVPHFLLFYPINPYCVRV